ncbi:hypothetical protein [Chamaesiphon sp. VAR_48_metabat_135_sub]|uniref:hypothetical protein n=1 Tax=Chamaesiphon sp. VAR_48_metabat_135_sub TaxID=2964699 RepID=UPI00286B750F|nr:hypothetical protein [Chamaesiphon sp. VAR_48_metabat_135_sub]
MKPSSISPRVFAILCATSLTIGMATPAITVTPPSKSTSTQKTPPPAKVIPSIKATPPTTATPANTPTPQPATTNHHLPLVAVPTLTPTTLRNFTNLYGQVLAVKFTPNQQQKISQRLSREWMANLGLRNTVFQTIAMEPQIINATPDERSQLQAKLVGNLRQQVLDGDADALWLVSFYDAAPKNWLAPGQPPLTRMTSDISADALCFMVNEVMGKSVATPDSKLKNSIAAKLTAEYAKIPANTKQELSRLPSAWLRFKDTEWFQRGDDFREQMRIHWGKNLEAYVPELREMSKLRRDRFAKLKADPNIQWDRMNYVQRQAALQKSEPEFQTSVRTLAQVKTVQLNNYISTMQVASSIGNSPTRYSVRLKIK